MRKTCFVIWLIFSSIFSYAGEVKNQPEKTGPVKFKYIKENKYSAIDIYGEITDTDDLESFTINYIPVKIYKKEFNHRVYLKAGIQPLEIRINSEYKEIPVIQKINEKLQDNLKIQIENDPYNFGLHKRYVEEENKADVNSIKKQYDKWFDNERLNPRELPNVCLVYFVGYAYELSEMWDIAQIKYEETIYLDEYFAPAHLGLARCHIKNNDINKALEHSLLACLYNYNNVFGIDPIKNFYNKFFNNDEKEEFYSAYIDRAFYRNPKILKKQFLDVRKQFPKVKDMDLAKTYLEILSPKRVNIYDDELKEQIRLAEEIGNTKQLSDILKTSDNGDVCKMLGEIFSILGDYNRQNSDDEEKPDVCDKLALLSYYKAKKISNIEKLNNQTADDAIIELHKERDYIRGSALQNKAKRLEGIRSALLLREALLCFSNDEKKREIIDYLDKKIYKK